MNTKYSTGQQGGQHGAALILAIAIMTVLLAIALTFFAVSKAELDNATNVRNRVQADLLVDSALAIAMAELNRDFLKHPNATSTDFKPFVLFNGSWAVGKQWALRNGIPLQEGGVPLVNMTNMPFIRFADGGVEQMFSGVRSQDWLTYPRYEDPSVWGGDPVAYADVLDDFSGTTYGNIFDPISDGRPPFVTPAFYGRGFGDSNADGFYSMELAAYPLELIHTWTDIDNDLDGLRDSIWIPIPRDRFFSGGEVIDETTAPVTRMFDDDIDNDLDGVVDESPERDGSPMELASFVYWGGSDALDNDGDGVTDEVDEQKYFLTTPLPEVVIPIDLNADGIVPDFVPDDLNGGIMTPLTVKLSAMINVPRTAGPPISITNADLDAIDNDYDMLANDYQVYAYVVPAAGDLEGFRDSGVSDGAGGTYVEPIFADGSRDDSIAKLKSYERVDLALFSGVPSVLPVSSTVNGYPTFSYAAILPNLVVTHSGEPVCDLAGRAAVLIRDENAKMNMNVAGGHQYDPRFPIVPATQAAMPVLSPAIYRALGNGATTAEIETRVLPDVGVATAAKFWAQRMGAPGGDPTLWDASVSGAYYSDVLYPGYGRVDDNANALLSVLNGIDDDGDGLVDEGLYLPQISAAAKRFLEGVSFPTDDLVAVNNELLSTRYQEYFSQLGAFEGVDEPGEAQRYNPIPNLLAENRETYNITGFVDSLDNDLDNSVDERGELGDLQLQNHLQMEDIFQIGLPGLARLEPTISTFSTDRNTNFVSGREGIRAVNKLNYNFATSQQIAANFLLSSPIQSVTARPLVADPTDRLHLTTNSFADGLRQADIHIRSGQSGLMWGTDASGNFEPTIPYFAADPVLQAMQVAVDIVDNRDANNSRSELISERQKAMPQTQLELTLSDPWPDRIGIRGRIEQASYFPLEEIEDNLRDTMGISRKLAIRDEWWSTWSVAPTALPDPIGVTGENGLPEERQISYAVSGNEAIRINEIMVRPVRRVEAEAVPDPANVGAADLMAGVPSLPNFDPTPFGNNTPALPDVLPSFSIARESLGGAWGLVNGGTLGERSYLAVNTNQDIIEFTINETTGLPAGRYYLTVNTTTETGAATVLPVGPLNPPMLQSAIKYRDRTVLPPGQLGQSIIEDFSLNGLDFFQDIPDEQVGGFVPGAPAGWVFVDGTSGFDGFAQGYHADGVDGFAASSGSETYTVTVPENTSAYELRIAFRMNPAFILAGGTGTIAINSLDFSQEPDHEWLELVNVSDETVNLGGWEMEVGIPDRPPVPNDPFKSTWRIPEGTEIAARGTVLLAISKFDLFQNALPAGHKIGDNGMGLADGDLPLALPPFIGVLTGNLTVPPINDDSIGLLNTDLLYDVSGSVFRRFRNPNTNELTDYFDSDGDGRQAYYAAYTDWNGNGLTAIQEFPGLDNLAKDQVLASSKELGTALSQTAGDLPWDRIIQLEETSVVTSDNPFSASPSAKRLLDIDSKEDVAAFVLRGGVFPNYPEQDGIDNDGDGAYLTAAGEYIPGILDLDMVDNNFDGVIDERGILGAILDPRASEGVDEGDGLYNNIVAGRFFGAGSYEPGILPILFFNDRSAYPGDGDYVVPPTPWLVQNPADGSTGISAALAGGLTTPLAADYLGSDFDPLDWKVFTERRWYPGDNVVVTLYEGSALNGKVADRATYREYDVTNRTIDDIVDWPYTVGGPLNPDYPSIWPPNQMGLDFYRSLERKHPLYNGDRFGTENRWQATDGNYDDWADSISLFENELDTVTLPGGTTPIRLATTKTLFNVRPRFLDTHPSYPANPNALRNRQLFGHAIWGSPLRMNSVMRRGENPPDLELITDGTFADVRQFPNVGFAGPFDYFRTHEDGDFDGTGELRERIRLPIPDDALTSNTKSLSDQRWNLSRAVVANQPYYSPADLMRVPHQMYMHDALNTGNPINGYLRDMTMLNLGLRGDLPPANLLSYHQDIALRGASLGQDPVDEAFSPNLLAVAVNSMATDSVVLTMGQAEFRPILPDVSGDLTLLDWQQNPASGNPDDLQAPAAWTPIFLFARAADGPRANLDHFPNYPSYVNGTPSPGEFPLYYLFNGGYLGDTGNFGGVDAYNNVDIDNRWPLEKRTAMFVSENRNDLVRPAEALFSWDGDDGLENGEYVLYIGTYLPKMRERIEEAAKISVAVPGKTTPELLFGNGTSLELDDGRTLPVDPVTKAVLTRDPTNPRAVGQIYDPIYALDVITDPTEARGQAPSNASGLNDPTSKPGGLIHPDDWNPTIQYQAGEDGYIFYGNNAVGGWKPQIVKVTDNFLAIRVRNLGAPGQVGALSHIVLAPRTRTAGRVNVNTVDSRAVPFPLDPPTTRQEFFSTVLGLPGAVDVAQTIQPGNAPGTLAGGIPADADLTPPNFQNAAGLPVNRVTGQLAWTPPAGPAYRPAAPPLLLNGVPIGDYLPGQEFYPGGSVPPIRNRFNEIPGVDTDLLVPDIGLTPEEAHRYGAFRLYAMIAGGRTEHGDGRYYEHVSDMALDSSGFQYNYGVSRADLPILAGFDTDGVEDEAIYPLSNESNPAKRFDEVQARFRRLGNLVTTRSDVFEITMTVEAGYGVDANGDGFFNYRDPSEFVTQARTKATAVYERRSPSSQSAGQE